MNSALRETGSIRRSVHDFKTCYSHGFVRSELDMLLSEYPELDIKKFNKILNANMVLIIQGDLVHLHDDVENAIISCLDHDAALAIH
jgi:hypothetical protein